jgi:predicted SAM-dependent methyltransferase
MNRSDTLSEDRSMTTQLRTTKLELGSGQRPTPGYLHNDRNAFEDIDFVCSPWEIDLPPSSLTEILSLGMIEHLSYAEARLTFEKAYELLVPEGEFLFDVPDLPVWCRYVADHFDGKPTPFPIEHLLSTLYGWQRWPGDEHRSGWYAQKLHAELTDVGFREIEYGVEIFTSRGHVRTRMGRPADAHIYVLARK